MYASNEHEFNREEKEWVFLSSASPIVCQHLPDMYRNTDDVEDDDDDEDSSSITSLSSSISRSTGSADLPAIIDEKSTIFRDLAQIQTDETTEKHETTTSTKDSTLLESTSAANTIQSPIITQQDQTLAIEPATEQIDPTIEKSDQTLTETSENHETVSTHIKTENDNISNVNEETFMSEDMVSSSIDETLTESEVSMIVRPTSHSTHADKSNLYGLLIFILFVYFMLGHISPNERPVIELIEKKLMKTNERLNILHSSTMEEIEQQLNKQFDEKLEIIVNEILNRHNKEHQLMLSKFSDFEKKTKETEEKLLNDIDQLTVTNKKLEEKLVSFQQRLIESSSRKLKTKGHPKGSGFRRGLTSPLETVSKETVNFVKRNSVNSSTLSDQLNSSINDVLMKAQDFEEEKKNIFSNFVQPETVTIFESNTKKGIIRVVKNTQSNTPTYASWIENRAKQRENVRKQQNNERDQQKYQPWYWTIQRKYAREALRQQLQPTKIHPVNFYSKCPSLYNYPINPCCASKFVQTHFF